MKALLDIPNLHLLVSTMLCLTLVAIQLQTTISAESRSNYIIHMDRSHMPEPFTTHHHWHSSIIDSLADQKTSHSSVPSILYSYGTVFHGFSASLTPEELQIIKNSPGFVSSFRDRTAQLETTRSPEFLGLSSSAGIWPASNFGDNTIIGIIDTGVWPESESFHDRGMSPNIPSKWKGKCQEGQGFNSSMCNLKLIGAQYFNKGAIADGMDFNLEINSTRDTDGHGTHVASIAAGSAVPGASYFGYAKGTAQGIAPRARLAVYKVSWNTAMTTSDVLAGIDKAVEDGVDVLSISLSFRGLELYENPLAIAAFGAMEKGVVVSIAAGNGDRTVGRRLRNGAPWTVTVAAGSVDRTLGGTVSLGNGVSMTGWSLFPAGAIIEKFNLVYNRTVSACNSSELILEAVGHFADQSIVVCDSTLPDLQYDTESQMGRIADAQVGGAIFISNQMRVLELEKIRSPILVISPKDRTKVIRYAQRTENPIVSLKFQQTYVGTKPAPAVASYSLEGPPQTGNPFVMKPDIMAPGTWILAAWVPNVQSAKIGNNVAISSDYNVISGTSMATPHIAGVAALLKSVYPNWSPAAIKSAMMTTANPLDNTGKPIIDNGEDFQAAAPLAMGSGLVDPNRALDPGLVYDATPQDYVNFLCALNFTQEQITAVTRSRASDCSKASLDLNYPAFVALCENADASGNLKFRRTVTNVGEGPATYRVSVKTPTSSAVRVSPQKLVFGEKNEKQSYTVTVRCAGSSEDRTFGDLVWVESNGKRRVRSPIIVSPF